MHCPRCSTPVEHLADRCRSCSMPLLWLPVGSRRRTATRRTQLPPWGPDGTLVCFDCGEHMRPEPRVCPGCAAELPRQAAAYEVAFCPRCGSEDHSKSFCPRCGGVLNRLPPPETGDDRPYGVAFYCWQIARLRVEQRIMEPEDAVLDLRVGRTRWLVTRIEDAPRRGFAGLNALRTRLQRGLAECDSLVAEIEHALALHRLPAGAEWRARYVEALEDAGGVSAVLEPRAGSRELALAEQRLERARRRLSGILDDLLATAS